MIVVGLLYVAVVWIFFGIFLVSIPEEIMFSFFCSAFWPITLLILIGVKIGMLIEE